MILALALGWKILLIALAVALGGTIAFCVTSLLVVGMVPLWCFFNLTGGENILFVTRKASTPFLNRQITKPLNWCAVFVLLLGALWLSGCSTGHSGDYYEKEQPYYTREYWKEFRRHR